MPNWCINRLHVSGDKMDIEYLGYSFQSAWSPPVEWLEKVARDYPGLYFRLKYEKTGVGFVGVATAKEGKVSNRSIDY